MASHSSQHLFSYTNLIHAISGATGGFTAMTIFYPLDSVRTIQQVEDEDRSKSAAEVIREILKTKGITGLYQGWFPVISSLWCSNFVYFYSYNFLKMKLYGPNKPTPAKDLVAASIAGVINVLVTTPMWVVNTRLKVQGTSRTYTDHSKNPIIYQGIIDTFQKIIRYEGTASLWSGTGPSLLLVGNPTIQFVIYESLKRRSQRILGTKELTSLTLFVIGALAKAVATLVTYPVQTLQSRLRRNLQDFGQPDHDKPFLHLSTGGLLPILTGISMLQATGKMIKKERPTVAQITENIIRTSGWKGFYRGVGTKLVQTILTAALMFVTYEKISAAVFRAMLTLNNPANTMVSSEK